MRKHALLLSVAVISLILAACAPSVTRSPEVVYQAEADAVYAQVVRTISTAEPLRRSKGWIISDSDRAGGFLAAQSSQIDLFGVPTGVQESISVIISPQGSGKTAVVIQGSGGARNLAANIMQSLSGRFGQPNVTGGAVRPDDDDAVWLEPYDPDDPEPNG
jgi:hypothetical protein